MSLEKIDCSNHILGIILAIGEKGSSYANELSKLGYSFPTLYHTLSYTEEVGLTMSELEGSGGKGSLKRVYRLTPLGEEVYKHLSALDELLR